MTAAQKQRLRSSMAGYLRRCMASEPAIHYGQHRPVTSFMDMPEEGFTTDCSGLVISTFRWARTFTGILLPDPSGFAYNGNGNTDSLRHRGMCYKVPNDGQFYVGDMAHYRDEDHVIICQQNGDWNTAIWTSHGWEGGPQKIVDLDTYRRPEFLYVMRSKALA